MTNPMPEYRRTQLPACSVGIQQILQYTFRILHYVVHNASKWGTAKRTNDCEKNIQRQHVATNHLKLRNYLELAINNIRNIKTADRIQHKDSPAHPFCTLHFLITTFFEPRLAPAPPRISGNEAADEPKPPSLNV